MVKNRALNTAWSSFVYPLSKTGIPYYNNTSNKIIMYHSIGGGAWENISVERFRSDIRHIVKTYEVVDLPSLFEETQDKRVAITFDDGLMDFYNNAVPILEKFEVPATVFILSGSINDDDFYIDQSHQYEYMGTKELQELVDHELISIGNHTITHPHLPRCNDDKIKHEIKDAKRDIEEKLDIEINRFAYPYGDYDERCASIVRDTHRYGLKVGGPKDVISPGVDSAKIPRINGSRSQWEMKFNLTDFGSKLVSLRNSIIGK